MKRIGAMISFWGQLIHTFYLLIVSVYGVCGWNLELELGDTKKVVSELSLIHYMGFPTNLVKSSLVKTVGKWFVSFWLFGVDWDVFP